MRNQAWTDEEARLWDAVMRPPRRKVVTHSLDKHGDRYRKAREAIEKQRKKEFADEWRALRAFLAH